MKIFISLLIVGLVSGCAPTTLSPQLQSLYNEQSLVQSIGILQDAAIQSESQNLISTNDARIIVTATNTALKAIRDKPSGWKQQVTDVFEGLKKLPSANAKFISSITLIETIVSKI